MTLAGSGQDGVVDGPALQAKLSQPSGLALEGAALYSADRDGHTIRRVAAGMVSIAAGCG